MGKETLKNDITDRIDAKKIREEKDRRLKEATLEMTELEKELQIRRERAKSLKNDIGVITARKREHEAASRSGEKTDEPNKERRADWEDMANIEDPIGAKDWLWD